MRDESITIAKAIGIILMVVAHAGIPDMFNHFIVMFHMPLFFFVSGYCFKEKYLSTPAVFVLKRIKGLYVPFVKYSLLFLLLHNVFFYFNIYNDEFGFRGQASQLYAISDVGKAAIHIITRMTDNEQLLGGYWFLRELLLASILGYMIIKHVKPLALGGGILLVVTIVFSVANIQLPYFHVKAVTFLSTFFFVAGHIYKDMKPLDTQWKTIIFFIIVVIGSVTVQTSMLRFNAVQVIPYSICALSGTIITINLSRYVAEKALLIKKILVFIGDNTMMILTWHFLSFKIVSIVLIYCYGLPVKELACFPVIDMNSQWLWAVYGIIGVGVPLICAYILGNLKKLRIFTK